MSQIIGATLSLSEAEELAYVVRNGFVESRHAGAAVVTGPDGEVLAQVGPSQSLIYPRSTLKPFQAIASLRLGAELSDEQVALTCGSHKATRRHRDLAESVLTQIGLTARDLQCPADWPGYKEDIAAEAADVAAHLERTPLAYNCSGKHAAFLAACVAAGEDTGTYLDPEHPLQREVNAVIEEYCGEQIAHLGMDGCGAPAPVTSLAGLARGIGRVASAPGRRDAELHAARVASAMLDHPWAVHAPNASNTVVMRELGILAKLGADGVMVMGAPDGTAVAVKALDGGSRAGNLVALALIAQFAPDYVDTEALTRVLQSVVPGVMGRGTPVGSVQLGKPVLELIG
ncbi:MAG: asparaginase [Micrococcus sp.]|nr:asparaginase [Micrococcus sp.]